MFNKNLIPYYKLFDSAPVATAILQADSFKLEMANPKMLDLWGRSDSIIGIPLLDFLPELVDQRYPDYLKQVRTNGHPLEEKGAQVLLNRSGKKESLFMDYSYTPIFGQQSKATAILVMATDVCERELNRLVAQQTKRDLRAMVLSAPVPMCIYRGSSFELEVVNEYMMEIWQSEESMNLSVLNYVFHNGVPYTLKKDGVTYTYTPLGNGITHNAGVCVIATLN